MAPTPTSVDGLEAVETGNHEISGAPQARHRCAGRRENGGLAPMDRGTLRTRQRWKSLCPTLTSPRSGFPSSRLMV